MADMYLVSNSDMVGVADEIRAKSGKGDVLLFPDGWKKAISSMEKEIIKHADIPDYVKSEALEIAKRVQTVRKSDSIVFLGMSDNHHYGRQGEAGVDTYVDANGVQNNASNLHAMMASKILSYALNLDFIAHLGDGTWGNDTTTSALLQEQHGELYSWLSEAEKGIPTFRAIGNHDTGTYYHDKMIEGGNTDIYTETPEYLYNTFTKLAESENTVFGSSAYGGYCYRDFATKKLRVFLLNTSENILYKTATGKWSPCCLGSQRIWFANALLNLNSKSDASQWKVVVLSHYPADYGSTMTLSDVIRAYVEGKSITISHENGTNTTVNFSGKNSAKFVAQFHGHIHNFLYTKLSTGTTANNVSKYDAWRVGIPNAQYNRENYYNEKTAYTSDQPYYYIPLKDDATYHKTPNTADDTSFVVNVINPSEEKIYSFCYGAGEDRVIGYQATVYYIINSSLEHISLENTAISIEEGQPYTSVLTADDGYEISSVVVTMGGTEITNSVYNNGVINIPSVTGDIKITASASKPITYTNLIKQATTPVSAGNVLSTEIYNGGLGYRNGYRISGLSDSANASYVATGMIRWAKKSDGTFPILYIKGATLDTSASYVRCTIVQTNTATDLKIQMHKAIEPSGSVKWADIFNIETLGTNYYRLSVKSGVTLSQFTCAFRMSLLGTGDNLIITADEEIE